MDTDLTIKANEARRWVEQNPERWADLVDFVSACFERGAKCSIYDWVQRVRWRDYVDETGQAVGVNSDLVPIFSRLLIAEKPQLKGTIEQRKSMYDSLFGEVVA